MPRMLLKERGAFGNTDTGGVWLLLTCVIRCYGYVWQQVQPSYLVAIVKFGFIALLVT